MMDCELESYAQPRNSEQDKEQIWKAKSIQITNPTRHVGTHANTVSCAASRCSGSNHGGHQVQSSIWHQEFCWLRQPLPCIFWPHLQDLGPPCSVKANRQSFGGIPLPEFRILGSKVYRLPWHIEQNTYMQIKASEHHNSNGTQITNTSMVYSLGPGLSSSFYNPNCVDCVVGLQSVAICIYKLAWIRVTF
jgi:hypothetical protein